MDNVNPPPGESSAPPPASPPPLRPPPAIAPPPTPPPRKRRGWMVFSIVLLCLLAFSVLFNISYFVQSIFRFDGAVARHGGPRLDEVVIENYGARDKIAVIPIDGIITSQPVDSRGSTMVDVVKAQLERADGDSRVRAVVLKVDSPGGEVLASDEIARAIRDFQDNSGKPVVVSMGSLAASGGYYVAVPARWIVAHELTITGSIGVIMEAWNYRGLMDKVGLHPFVFKSGEHKDMLSGSREPSEFPEEERQMLNALISQTFDRFKEVVSEGREAAHEENGTNGRALAENWETYADGRVLSGKEAYQVGFVDQLGNFDDAVSKARNIADISDANLIQYQQRHDLSDLFNLFGQSEARVVKVDVGFDMPKLQAGRLYYIWPTYLR